MSTHIRFDYQDFLSKTPHAPGVYRMYGADDELLYIGKAKDLYKRIQSYFSRALDAKTLALVQQIRHMEYTLVATEVDALVLEHSLIKTHKPRYNILLKDDKSYPFLMISQGETYPRMDIYRGSRDRKAHYFGPYPSAHAARQSLQIMQKIFKIRPCENTFFKNRSRPCLQYQIKRCKAPCVGYVTPEEYAMDIEHAIAFLEGKTHQVIDHLIVRMDEASQLKEYETAAVFRDQVRALQLLVQQQQMTHGHSSLDVCVVVSGPSHAVITQLFVRNGEVVGHKNRIFKDPLQTDEALLGAFMGQYCLSQDALQMPREWVVNVLPEEHDLLVDAVKQRTGKPFKLLSRPQQEKKVWLGLALKNARDALSMAQGQAELAAQTIKQLEAWLSLHDVERIECFDVAHMQGDQTVASCVVFNKEGPMTADYRRFNISGITPGDDYAAMGQALTRHFSKLKTAMAPLPDLLIIDGGKGQLSRAQEVLAELQLHDIPVISVSKGPDRKPGEEQIWRIGREPERLAADSALLHFIQRIRDEAHRFAITGHRRARAKTMKTSTLEGIPGVGPKRRQALLKHFGGLQGLKAARVEAIAKVPFISLSLAQTIFDYLHGNEDKQR
ncbi:MAG: excinuclease ABC subunit UvrC [Gammaproteobacteria bacterium]